MVSVWPQTSQSKYSPGFGPQVSISQVCRHCEKFGFICSLSTEKLFHQEGVTRPSLLILETLRIHFSSLCSQGKATEVLCGVHTKWTPLVLIFLSSFLKQSINTYYHCLFKGEKDRVARWAKLQKYSVPCWAFNEAFTRSNRKMCPPTAFLKL